MHLAEAMDFTGVKENTLSQRSLARINMSRDPDVARALQRVGSVLTVRAA
jgi:hypothetical protein